MVRSIGITSVKDTPESLAFGRILDYYGHFCRPGEKRKDDELNQYSVPILAEIPLRITDERRMTTRLCWLNLDEVGTISVGDDPPRILEAPAISSLIKATRERYMEIAQTVEADMVLAAPSKFAELTYESFFLQSLVVAVAKLEEDLEEGVTVPLDDRRLKYFQYIIDSGYATPQVLDGDLVILPNENFIVARRRFTDSMSFYRELTGIVLGKKYQEITTRLRPLKANVRGCLVYYEPAVEYGEPIAMTEDGICSIFKRKYHPSRARMDAFKFVILPGLERVGILHRDGGKIEGDPDVYEEFYDLAHEKIPIVHRTQMETGNVVGPGT